MIVKKTYKDLFDLNSIAGAYLSKTTDKNKIGEALEKMFKKQVKPHFEEYWDKLDDIQRNNCLTDASKQGAIMKDDKGGRMYSKDGEVKMKAEEKRLKAEEVELTPLIPEGIDDLIKDLTDEEKEAFSGLVIPAQEIKE